jgi:hypothetical protein
MALVVAVVDTMAVAQVCRAVVGVMAEVEVAHHMRIKRLHQPLLIPEEIIVPMVIVQLHGQVQGVVLHCFQSL